MLKLYTEDLSKELDRNSIDLSKGFIDLRDRTVHHPEQKEIPAEGHYEIIAEYENGGKDVEWVVDTPGVPYRAAYDEFIQYEVFVPFPEEEIKARDLDIQIVEYENLLAASDYKIIKRLEQILLKLDSEDEELKTIKQDRQSWRDNINQLREQRDKRR